MRSGAPQPDLERFRDLAEQALDLIAELDGEGRLRYASPSYRSVLGYDPDALLETSIFDLVHPDDVNEMLAVFESAIERDEADEVFCRVLTRDGCVRWMHTRGRPYRSEAGELRVGLASRDITDRISAHAALQQSERRYRALVETASCGILESDLEGRIQFANPAFADMLSVEPEALIGRGIWEFHHDENERERIRKRISEGGLDRPDPVQRTHRLMGVNGVPVAVAIDWNYRLDEHGDAIGFVTVATDVTRREQTDAALAKSHRFITRIADTSPAMICVFDLRDRSLSYANSRTHDILGWRVDDLRALGPGIFKQLIHPEDRRIVASTIAAALRSDDDDICSTEYRVRHAEGDWRWLEAHYAVFNRDADGRPTEILSSQVDVTEKRQAQDALRAQEAERRRAEEEARRLEEQLLQAQKLESLGVLAGGIAHDFNNLLVGILGNASLALSEVPLDSPLRETLEAIETAGLRAGELTHQMLAYSGKGRFVVEPIDLNALAKEMAHLLGAVISKKATLHLDLEARLPAVDGDATQLRQLVMNLITNASDALGDETGHLTLRTWAIGDARAFGLGATGESQLSGPAVVFEVADSGCGMDAETASRIFDPFFTTKFTGRGLGLAATMGIVRGHGGAVDVESAPGAGTRFRVLLPACSQPAAIPREPVSLPPAEAPARGTVLVADDEDVVRRIAQRILEGAGFDVLTAADGVEAIARFQEHGGPVAAVLLDLTMPRLGGEETLRRLREIAPEIPVILTSGYSESEVGLRFEGVRLEGFLHKPFRPNDLLEKVRAIVES